jgi:hypothetical protein
LDRVVEHLREHRDEERFEARRVGALRLVGKLDDRRAENRRIIEIRGALEELGNGG